MFLLILNFMLVGWQYLQPAKYEILAKPLPPELKRLQLLTEINEKAQSRSTAASMQAIKNGDTTAIETVFEATCYTLGPFKDEKIIQQVQSSLSEQGLVVTVRTKEERLRHRYWVYLAAFENREKSLEMSKKLQDKNIKDFYIVSNNSLGKGISLGHFKEKDYAERRVNSLKRLGFDAKIEMIYRNINIFWLDYQLNAKQSTEGGYVRELLVGGITRLDRACDIN